MSTRELRRAGVLARVAAGTLTLRSAAELMGVSYRQAKRVYGRYRTKGAAGLRHGNAGRPSNRDTASDVGSGCWRWSGRNMGASPTRGLARRWRPNIWPVKMG
jgi:hypothetical protein